MGLQRLKPRKHTARNKFWDVGALVWFARIIQWEFPGFSVTDCLPNLYHAQEILEKNGVIEGRIHRFLLVVQK